jgi:hypothetical protein
VGIIQFSIDEHILEVVTTDFVPIHPYKTNYVTLAVSFMIPSYFSICIHDGGKADNILFEGWEPCRCASQGYRE